MKRANERDGRRAGVVVEPLEGRALMSVGGLYTLSVVWDMRAQEANADALAGAAEQQSMLAAQRGTGVSRVAWPW